MKKLKFIFGILLFLTSGANAGYCPATGCVGWELEYPNNYYITNNAIILRQDISGQYYFDGQSYLRNYQYEWDKPTQTEILRQEILQEMGIW
tara:strand:+ start:106 stop:381 length:276 start_codon:yes stop_codon:yes gene_type:complete